MQRKAVRQGDVLLMPVATARGVSQQSTGRIILAFGEQTGHHHSVSADYASLLVDGAKRFLSVNQATTLEHQEHDPLPVAKGDYEVVIQARETGARATQVAD